MQVSGTHSPTVPSPYALLRPLLFRLPPETAHRVAAAALRASLAPRPLRAAFGRRTAVHDEALAVSRWGLQFPNPVGVAAGFDKAGSTFNALAALGFGFVEIGTVTARAQAGNPLPRLFRLPADEALLNRMGFNNPGALAVADRLRRTRIEPILGINIGKSKTAPLDRATDDYLESLALLEPFADYLVVNVSSPNTPGLRALQEAGPLRHLLRALHARKEEMAQSRRTPPRPLLVKLAPDLTDGQLDEAVDIAGEEGAAGIIAVNTTVERGGLRTPAEAVNALGTGGISGAPLRERATAAVRRIFCRTGGRLPIIGVGGIFTADDAWERIRAGASLVQLYSSLVYRGPGVVREINLGLLERVQRAGLRSVEEAVGVDAGAP